MSILTEPRPLSEPPMWLRDMTTLDLLAVERQRYTLELLTGVRTPCTPPLTEPLSSPDSP